jgi:hypothetical protein
MKASKEYIASQLYRLNKAFPKQDQDFFKILMERVLSYEFTEEEIKSTVNHVLDTFEYGNLTIASILKIKIENEETKRPIVID